MNSNKQNSVKKTKILFINPMVGIEGFLPIGLSSLIAVLIDQNFTIDIFDTTYYKTTDYNDRSKNERVGEFLPVDMSQYGVVKVEADYIKDMNDKISAYNPDLIGVTIPTAYNFPMAKKLIEGINDYHGPLAVGGKFVTVAPEKSLEIENVNILCIGEGEGPLLNLCNRIEEKSQYNDIANLWIKNGSQVIRNDIGLLEDIESLPAPNWDLYDNRHFYKPFSGKVYRYGHIELSRGCPHRCSYCINDCLQKLYKGKGRYYRKKSVRKALQEITFLKEKHNLEIIKFWDEEFLLFTDEELEEFTAEYAKMDLPFLCDVRLDQVTENKARLLKKMGCVNVSAGIESGSKDIRKKVLNRRMTNKQMIEGIRLLNKFNIRTSTLNMLGMPFETRKNVFETIELNRIANAQNSSVMILQPWYGTKIRQVAVEAGFMVENCENYLYTTSYLDMPQLSKKEIEGLAKTFSLYRKVPKFLYPLVKICEKDGKWRDRLFVFLHKIFKSH